MPCVLYARHPPGRGANAFLLCHSYSNPPPGIFSILLAVCLLLSTSCFHSPNDSFPYSIGKNLLIFKRQFYVDNILIYGKVWCMGMISYKPLWKTMKDRGVTTYTLIYKHGFSAYTITNLRRNKSITVNTLEKLCTVLKCTPNDIIQFIQE